MHKQNHQLLITNHQDTITESTAETFVNELHEVPLALHNLHQILKTYDPKSGPFGKSVELLEKLIVSLKTEPDVFKILPILPVLTDVLLRSSSRIEYILKLIQDVSFGVIIKTNQPFVERLIKFCVNTLCDEATEVSQNYIY